MSPPILDTQSKIDSASADVLEQEIRRHNRLYFEKHQPEISDYLFDQIVERLRFLKPDSSLFSEIPSESLKEFKKVPHTSPMLSLDKCYTDKDLNDWAEKFEGEVVAMPKIDGCAVELRYDDQGALSLGATRGDGLVGDDITPNVKTISDIPHKIPHGPLEIRGEIYMRLSVFHAHYKDKFANPRNLAAGAIKQKNPQKTAEYQLSFFGYDLLGIEVRTEDEKHRLLQSFGLPTLESRVLQKDNLRPTYDYFLAKRDEENFETDGVVLKANRISEQERLGLTAHHPRYAIAYKFQGDSGVTTLKDIEWSVARTGVITPIAIVEPVTLSGASVSRISLHHAGMMKQFALRENAKVVAMRRGGVIPNLESVVEVGEGRSFEMPTTCPSCGFPTEVREDFLYCTNRQGCRQTKIQELEHFIKSIECDGFGEKLIEKLYDEGFVQDPADFFALKKENLLELDRMGEILATKLIGNLHAKRELSLAVFLRSLGIRELAKHTSKLLVTNFQSLEKILNVSVEELSAIHSIGPVIAQEVVEGLRNRKPLIEKLLKYVKVGAPRPSTDGAGPSKVSADRAQQAAPLRGKKFLFTGSLFAMERGKAEKMVEEQGGEIASGVTRDLDYLVVGDGGGAGSKLEKARALQAKGGKVQIISEKEWMELL